MNTTFTNSEKQALAYFITCCHQSGKDPHTEATKRFREVLDMLTINTKPYRLAWSVPTGFYVVHTAQEAFDILTKEGKA